MTSLTLYTKTHCPYCTQAKTLLKRQNIDFNEVNIEQNPEAKEFLVQAGHKSVPQIYQNNQLFVEGGYNGLAALTEFEIKERLQC